MERAIKFLELFRSGKTYQEIGDIFGVSRQLVYMQLRKHLREETKEILSNRTYFVGKRHKAKELISFTCINCGKTKQSKYRYHKLNFCDHKCRGEFMKKSYAFIKEKTGTYQNME